MVVWNGDDAGMSERTQITFVVQGDDGPDLADSLDRAHEAWRREHASRVEDPKCAGKFVLHVIVTDPTRETSVDHALSYARSEIKDSIGAAGGSIWDGTHVQIRTVGSS